MNDDERSAAFAAAPKAVRTPTLTLALTPTLSLTLTLTLNLSTDPYQALEAAARRRWAARRVEEELLIVDLGAGCGLLSLLAARAAAACGARARVLAVERERPVAEMAREIFGANRQALPDGVTLQVIEADSGALCLGGALPRRADIVVSEVLGDDPLAEGVLLALHHAHTHLLAHGGEMLPSALSVVAALVAMPTAADLATLRPAVGGRHGGPLRLLEPGRVGTDLRQHGAPASASASASG